MPTAYATVNADGTLSDQTDRTDQFIYSSQKLGVGTYEVIFGNSRSGSPNGWPGNGVPVVVATAVSNTGCGTNGVNCSISITEVTNAHVCFGIMQASDCNTPTDCAFNFIATSTGQGPG